MLKKKIPDSFRIRPKKLKPNPFFIDLFKKRLTYQGEKHRDELKQEEEKMRKQEQLIRLFSDLPQQHAFWLNDGRVLKNLNELYNSFYDMPEEVFRHHVTKDKNDFANWVRDVLKDDLLADYLEKAKTSEEAILAIENRIEELKEIDDQESHLHKIKELQNSTSESEEKTPETKGFLSLLRQISIKNKKLEKELEERKKLILKKEEELKKRELKSSKKEQELLERFKLLEKKEAELMSQIEKETAQITNDEKLISRETESKPIDEKFEEMLKRVEMAVFAKKFDYAKELLPRLRQYYDKIDDKDPLKMHFYNQVIRLKQEITLALDKKGKKEDKEEDAENS